MKALKHVLPLCLFLTACAQTPSQTDEPVGITPQPAPAVESASASHPHEAERSHTEDDEGKYPPQALSPDWLYRYLLTEIASQRGEELLAVNEGIRLAKETRDVRLVRRIAGIVFDSGDMLKTIEVLKLWGELEPEATVVDRMLSSVLLKGGRLEEAEQIFSRVLTQSNRKDGLTFLQIGRMAASVQDREAALQMMQRLAADYPALPEAQWAVGHMAFLAGQTDLALAKLDKALQLRPGWAMAVSLKSQILKETEPEKALTVLEQHLSEYPKAYDIRLRYARTLLDQKQYREARAQFVKLSKQNQRNPELLFAAAMISLQLDELDVAEQQLLQAMEKGKRESDVVQFYLGQLNENLERLPKALAHYRKVAGGEYYLQSQLRIAFILSEQGNLAQARQHLQQLDVKTDQERIRLILAETDLLRQAGQDAQADAVLQQALQQRPDDPDLLYEIAIVAEKQGRLDEFERIMQRLMDLYPDQPSAYNALGYSWLERQVNLEQAVQLIRKARELAPDDVAIKDSMGWAYYRMGEYDKSLALLQEAYNEYPDPEIAAHLGEVLWMLGHQQEAREIWQQSLKDNPDAQYLIDTMNRLMPEEQ